LTERSARAREFSRFVFLRRECVRERGEGFECGDGAGGEFGVEVTRGANFFEGGERRGVARAAQASERGFGPACVETRLRAEELRAVGGAGLTTEPLVRLTLLALAVGGGRVRAAPRFVGGYVEKRRRQEVCLEVAFAQRVGLRDEPEVKLPAGRAGVVLSRDGLFKMMEAR
jgi:hypothetical protein